MIFTFLILLRVFDLFLTKIFQISNFFFYFLGITTARVNETNNLYRGGFVWVSKKGFTLR